MSKEQKLHWIYACAPFLYRIALILSTLYVFFRSRSWANRVFGVESGWILGIVFGTCLLLNFFTVKKHRTGPSRGTTYFAGIGTFVMIYLLMTIGTVDLVRLLCSACSLDARILDRVFLIGGWLSVIVTFLCTLLGMYQVKKLKLLRYEVPVEQLSGRVRLVLLTDLHIGYFVGAKHMAKVRDLVNAQNSDMVLISGDMINASNTNECGELPEVERILSEFQSREGTFAVVGNHDPDASDPEFQKFLQNSHIHLLEDAVYSDGTVNILGRTTKLKPRASIRALKEQADDHLPSIVLDHDPIGIREAREEHMDLVLCGHTHRGQIFPLNLFVRFLYNRAETYGYSRQGNTVSIVSAGTGYFSMPMRLGSDCEVITIDLIGKAPSPQAEQKID